MCGSQGGWGMSIFISYSRFDEAAVRDLMLTLQKAGFPVWVDQEIRGGESWWQEVLAQIRKCSVFVFALSDSSLGSTPCKAELDYAMRLGLPVLPVQVAAVQSLRSSPVANLQIINYYSGNPRIGVELMVALQERQRARRPLPQPPLQHRQCRSSI